ncbi:MAG: GNAT family N-acetyltransferase [Bacteroidales bacterium]|nr:GNAT family N-acetyltransferase [Bacteroidales bacterium]
MEVIITQGRTEDIEVIAKFQVDMAMESEGTQLDKETVIKGVTAAMNDENKGLYYVARVEGKVVGSLMLTREWSDWNNGWYWWIQSVYVAPDYRRQGIYKSMYQAVCRDAKEQNVAQVRLYVDKTNTLGQKVYSSLGMQESHYLIYETCLIPN